MTRPLVAAFVLAGLLAACGSSSSPSPLDASTLAPPEEEAGAVLDSGIEDANEAGACGGEATDSCALCEQKHCCDQRAACLADAACNAARQALDACIASTDAGTSDRHSCFMTFEKKGKKALALHLCGEDNCRSASACAIP